MAKVVLVRPRSGRKTAIRQARIPLALLYMGSVLRQMGHKVEVVDADAENDYKEHILDACKGTTVVGISALTVEVKDGLDISSLIRGNSDVPIVWGGIHPSLFPEMTCEDSLVDFVAFGEGEYTMLALVDALETHKALSGVDGLVYKDGGGIKKNQPRPFLNLDDLPAIDYTLIDMERYFEGRSVWRREVDMQTSRGCPYACAFCCNPFLSNRKVRLLSAEKVVDECERLVKEYGANYISFVDDNFFINKKRAEDICVGIINRKLKFEWFAEVRADYFKEGFVDSRFLKLAEESGLRNVTVGAESGVLHCLEEIKKGITLEEITNSAEMIAQTDILAAYSFIIGLPNETREDIVQTLEFAERLKEICPNIVCAIGILAPYPKSEFAERFLEEGWITQPESLREFAMSSHIKLYTKRAQKPIWHSDPNFAYIVASYGDIAYGSLDRESVRKHLKYASVLLLPEMLLKKLAFWRLRHQFFWFKFDLYIRRLLRIMYLSGWARRIAIWKAGT